MILYIDLDRTLFDTAQFVIDRDRLLLEIFDVKVTAAETAKFYRRVDDLVAYDFNKHMASYGLGLDDLEQHLLPALKAFRPSYLYDDAIGILDKFDFEVLTFGEEPYQRLKFQLAPEIESVAKTIVMEPKYDYITRLHGSQPVVLVDDKPGAAGETASIEFIHIDRADQRSIWRDEAGVHISSLEHLAAALNT